MIKPAIHRNSKVKRLIHRAAKRTSFTRVLAAAFTLFTFAGCGSGSNPVTAGGSGTETTNGIVLLSSGEPAVNAQIQLFDRDRILAGDDTVFTAVTDRNGRFSITHDSIAREQIVVKSDSEAISIFGEDLAETTVLAPFCSFSGTAVGESDGLLMLAGIDTAAVVSGGSFRFEKIPAGWYPVIFSRGGKRYSAGSVTLKGDLDSAVNVPSSGTLLADFSDGFDRNPLTELLGGTEWKTFSSREQRIYRGGLWQFELFNDSLNSAVVTPVISGGTLSFTADGITHAGSYAGVRLKLFSADLSKMTALKFRARGNGTVRINLEAGVLNGTNDQYGFTVVLTKEWQSYSIPVSDFHLESAVQESKTPWRTVSSKIQRIECSFHGSSNLAAVGSLNLEIDDIIFEGTFLDDLQ